MKKQNILIAAAAGAGLAAVIYKLATSKSIPDGATAFHPFDKMRYLGVWNEIARLPNSIEKGYINLTEDYSLNDDGTMKVVTKAYSTKKGKWKDISGKIKFAGSEDVGALKVSYFGPVYLSYNVLDLDADYKYALVSGSRLDYLWILSKETFMPEDIKLRFLNKAIEIGFAVDKLEWF